MRVVIKFTPLCDSFRRHSAGGVSPLGLDRRRRRRAAFSQVEEQVQLGRLELLLIRLEVAREFALGHAALLLRLDRVSRFVPGLGLLPLVEQLANVGFDRVGDDEVLDAYFAPLPHAPRAADGLLGQRGVKRGLDQEHVRRRGQVDADGARAHGEQKHGGRRVLLKRLDRLVALLEGHAAADGAETEAFLGQALLQPGQSGVELREDQRLVRLVLVAHLAQLGDQRLELAVRVEHDPDLLNLPIAAVSASRAVDVHRLVVGVDIGAGGGSSSASPGASAWGGSSGASSAATAAGAGGASLLRLPSLLADVLDVDRRAAAHRGARASVATLAGSSGAPPAAATAAAASAASAAAVCVESRVGGDVQQAIRAEEVAASGPQGPVADILADAALLVGAVQGRGHHGLGVQDGSGGSTGGDARVGFHGRAAAAEVGLDVPTGFSSLGGVPAPVLRRRRRRSLPGEVHLEVRLREVAAGAKPAERQQEAHDGQNLGADVGVSACGVVALELLLGPGV